MRCTPRSPVRQLPDPVLVAPLGAGVAPLPVMSDGGCSREITMTTEKFDPPAKARRRVLLLILQYLGAYLLGILTCILFTPVAFVLAGKALWPFYPFAVIGFLLYYFYLAPQHVFGPAATYWLAGSIGLVPFVLEAAVYFSRSPRLRAWRPMWIGFPIGFVGTLGVFYTAAASI
ncbi:MAG: hypothetical protein ACFCUX_04870 [Candidatus Methylacidiphilales bacterium]